MIKIQNFIWPANPSYDNPIVAVMHKDRYCRFNFILKDGSGTNINPGEITLETTSLDADDIKRVVLWWSKGTSLLNAIELSDK